MFNYIEFSIVSSSGLVPVRQQAIHMNQWYTEPPMSLGLNRLTLVFIYSCIHDIIFHFYIISNTPYSNLYVLWSWRLFSQTNNECLDSHVCQCNTCHQPIQTTGTVSGSHYNDVIMSMIASQITSLTIVYSTVYSGADQRKHQSPSSLAFVWGIHRGPVNSPHKGPVTRKMFPFDDVIMDNIR